MASGSYDLFVCYSSADRLQVVRIAELMRRQGLRVWLDDWELKPGDSIIKHVESGIQRSRFMLAIVSENSMKSHWVQHELSASLFIEASRGSVEVIAAVVGGAGFEDLPQELRRKHCLDMRSASGEAESVSRLVDLIRPELRKARELKESLRNPQDNDAETISLLSRHSSEYGDQSIQIAALRGLSKLSGNAAVLEIARRSLDTFGMKVIETTLQILGKRADDGGLFALAGSLLRDYRFFDKKISVMEKAIGGELSPKLVWGASARGFDAAVTGRAEELQRQHSVLSVLIESEIADIRHGAVIALSTARIHPWMTSMVTLPDNTKRLESEKYASVRLPGFLGILDENSRSKFALPI
ncbi:toll/interleukin-1 receptor domain-containing protein [Streptomyces sp. NPDC004031]